MVLKRDCKPPMRWIPGVRGVRKGECVGGDKQASSRKSPAMKRIRKLKADCIEPFHWIVGKGCFEPAGGVRASPRRVSAPRASPPKIGERLKLKKGECLPPNVWQVGKGCFQGANETRQQPIVGPAPPVLVPFEKKYSYKVQDRLGAGSFGEVYKVQDKKTKGYFAAKFFKSDIDYQEMNIMTALSHPALMYATDVMWSPRERLVMVMPLADSDLHRYLSQNTLTNDQAIEWMFRLLSGLKFLHSIGNFHCDIKPGNILVVNGEPRLADFGFSHPIISDPFDVCGTPTYTSLNADGTMRNYLKSHPTTTFTVGDKKMSIKELNPRADFVKTDIHALGISFIHMIGGRSLLIDFHRENDSKKRIEKMITAIPYAILTQCAARGLPNDLQNLLLGMTAIDQAARIPSVDACLKAPIFKKFGKPIPGKINPGRPLTDNPQALAAIQKIRKMAGSADLSMFAFAEQIAKRLTGLGVARNETELVAMAFFGAMQITGLHSNSILKGLKADTHWIEGEGFPQAVAALKGILVTPVQIA
jgi:serine/threonine protein kinase